MRVDHDAEISRLFAAGVKVREIAERLEMGETTVWARAKKLGLSRHIAPRTIGITGRSLSELRAQAEKYGPVDFDDAPLPNGAVGYIAFIGDVPGCACAGERAALRSALSARQSPSQ